MKKIWLGILLGGALSSFFVTQNLLAYSQHTTHPALTDQAVDFYNLNFSQNPISEKEKQLLIKGAVEEDILPRSMNHFYDPVYKRGWAGYRSSKLWARSSAEQQEGRSFLALNLWSLKDSVEDWPRDYSYERGLLDYAKGNKDRAFESFGHVMHLLEDANVPEHTRNDTHVGLTHDSGSPYESTMAKWNPSNFDIAKKLKQSGQKPVLLNDLDQYFDSIAGYSNGYFFSEDTIFSEKYIKPSVDFWKYERIGTKMVAFGYKNDKKGYFRLVKELDKSQTRNIVSDRLYSINDENKILDGYWDRLSKDFVLHGAGALKMILDQAEEAKKKYENEMTLRKEEKENKSWIASIFGLGDKNNGIALVKDLLDEVENTEQSTEVRFLTESPRSNLFEDSRLDLAEQPIEVKPLLRSDLAREALTLAPAQTPISSPTILPAPSTTPTPTTKVEPLLEEDSRSNLFKDPRSDLEVEKININTAGKEELMILKGIGEVKSEAIVEYRQTRGLFEKIEDIMNVKWIGEATFNGIKDFITVGDIAATFGRGGGSSGGGGGSQTVEPTPTPTPTTATEPEPLEDQGSTPDSSLRKIVINEIAWMGTASLSNDEWIELYNTSSQSVDLTGWTLRAQDGTPDISLASMSISPFGFYLLERTDNTTISNIEANQIYTGALGNEGEILELRDAGGNLQDFINTALSGWEDFGGNNSTKFSMERISPDKSGNNSSNWGTNNGLTKNGQDAGGVAISGTPKSKNSLYVSKKPNKVTNLAISSQSSFDKVFLNWTNPGDPDTMSTSLSYDFRYATKSFDTADDWDNAPQGPTLGVDNFEVVLGDFNKTYYFALKTKDSDGNFSDISNQASYSIPSAIAQKNMFLGPASSSAVIKWGIQFLGSPPYNFGQPVIAPNGTIYFGTSNGTVAQLYAIAPDNSEKWHYDATNGATIGTPTVLADSSVLFGYTNIGTEFNKVSSDGNLKYVNNIGKVYPVVIDNNGTSYFTSSEDRLVSVALDGTQKWAVYKDGIAGLTPMLINDKVYLTSRLSGVPNFYAFDAETGNLLWSKRMSTGSSTCCGVSNISFDADDDFLYAGADQYILRIDRQGDTLDQYFADRQMGWGYTTTMISQTSDNLIFGLDFSINDPASKSAVYAVNKVTKELAWKYAVDAKINKQIPVDSQGNSYFSTQNGWVYSLSQNGVLNWKIDLSGTTSAYPVIDSGVLYITLDKARLVKIGE